MIKFDSEKKFRLLFHRGVRFVTPISYFRFNDIERRIENACIETPMCETGIEKEKYNENASIWKYLVDLVAYVTYTYIHSNLHRECRL